MSWLDVPTESCSIQRTLAVLGEKWTILLIRDAANGVHRFDDFRRHIGLSEAVLSDRLKTLVENGILETREYQADGQRKRREYRLTAKGWDLNPALVALGQWGDEYMAGPEGPARRIEHNDCGHVVRAVVQCTHDGTVLTPRDMHPVELAS